jgi:RNA polymerase sigma-70 factor (ECF subfamily)
MMVKLVTQAGSPAAEGTRTADDPLLPLARLAGGGDRNAMRDLVKAVGPAMLRAVRKVMGHRTADVEDVLQEAAEGFLLALQSFKGQCTVLHFACRVAVLSALALRRKASFRAELVVDAPDAGETTASLAPSPMDHVTTNRRRHVVGQLLDELPPAQAELLVLHCALGFTMEELAASLGRPVETVRSRVRLAKQALRERISASSELTEILEVER